MIKEGKFDILDITKLVLSFMVVAIHSSLFPQYLYPWLRLAIPLFFIISSFLLFRKISMNPDNRNEIVKKYVVRLLKLYIFWFIVLLPYTIVIKRYMLDYGAFLCIVKTIISVLFSSTFPASWFIIASIEGTLLVNYFDSKKLYKTLILLSIVSYIFCCLGSSYSHYFSSWAVAVFKFMEFQFTFLVSLVYIIIGKMFAEGKFINVKKWIFVLLSVIFGILLFIEWKAVYSVTGILKNDCYFLLLPTAFSLFGIIINTNVKIPNSKALRQLSSFIYPFHMFVATVARRIIKVFIGNEIIISSAVFLTTIVICIISFYIVKKLQKYSLFKFLENSY